MININDNILYKNKEVNDERPLLSSVFVCVCVCIYLSIYLSIFLTHFFMFNKRYFICLFLARFMGNLFIIRASFCLKSCLKRTFLYFMYIYTVLILIILYLLFMIIAYHDISSHLITPMIICLKEYYITFFF